jgi:Nucleotidyl transferase AbiEii toxin, Type IV TA system
MSKTVRASSGADGAPIAIGAHASASSQPSICTRPVTPFVADELPYFDLKIDGVTTILGERTFWDKIIIAHGLRAWFDRRGELRQEGQRVSRHYYDLHAIFPTETGTRALANRLLGRECVRHAAMFFGRPDFNLESAAAGKFVLAPRGSMLSGLRRDYAAMAGMIFGAVPAFDSVMTSITRLESYLWGS